MEVLVRSPNRLLTTLIRTGHLGPDQQSAACSVSHATIARLARWRLRVRDATGSDELIFSYRV
jgi:hypothetical protein